MLNCRLRLRCEIHLKTFGPVSKLLSVGMPSALIQSVVKSIILEIGLMRLRSSIKNETSFS